uniref:Annexin n=1 Tax=Aegilops tauschii TaxID=37682 RepID=R7WE19_AEGTA
MPCMVTCVHDEGGGADEKALVEILGRRTAAQRAEIRRAYASLYKESLLTRLHGELSGHFQKAMVLLATDPAERDAKLAREALGRRGDDRDAWVLIEAACAAAPDHLVAVRRAYRSLHGSSLEEDVAACSAFQEPLRKVTTPGEEQSNPFQSILLVSLVRSYRCAEESVDMDVAKLEAAQLAEAIRRKKQPHAGEVVRIVSTRSKPQLAATFRCYKEQHGSDIEEDMKQYSSSQFARMLKIAVWCLTSPEKHFAEVIRYSILGLGTDEDALTRAIVSRADIDMKKIKQEYRVRFKTTVTDDVVGDTSGYYMDILLALVGKE